MENPLDKQVSGDWYKNLKIQPVEYNHKNKIPFIEGCVIKYVTRHRAKNGRKDIEKAIHFLELLLHLEYPKGDNTFESCEGWAFDANGVAKRVKKQ